MTDNFLDFIGIGTSSQHAILSTTHLTRSNHFHGFCDLRSVLNTLDLGSYLFSTSHN